MRRRMLKLGLTTTRWTWTLKCLKLKLVRIKKTNFCWIKSTHHSRYTTQGNFVFWFVLRCTMRYTSANASGTGKLFTDYKLTSWLQFIFVFHCATASLLPCVRIFVNFVKFTTVSAVFRHAVSQARTKLSATVSSLHFAPHATHCTRLHKKNAASSSYHLFVCHSVPRCFSSRRARGLYKNT